MIKIAILFVIIGEFVLFIAKAVSWIFQRLTRKEVSPEPLSRDWYGNCENCGKLGGLHRFQGKRYCAVCHARIKTAWDFSPKEQNDTPDK